ncbi:MAG: aminopeptidase N, partial [Candidatus Thiodiazotropha sp. (ex Notomyrtea botanica)]|nr:aminopeptidase N [Candidatus Thiodiazotropha sp. (ex Notomyrtea botanica)]
MRTDNAKTIYLKDYLPPDYLIEHVDLAFDLRDEVTQVVSRLQVKKNPASQRDNPPLQLDGEGLTLIELTLDDHQLQAEAYQYDFATLTISDVPERFSLLTRVEIRPQENTALEGLYQSG